MVLLSNYFSNTIGLYALLSLIPLILLYLIKPKPKKLIIPSLLFFIKESNKSNINSFLQKFIRDLLFFLQLLVLILLSLTIANPFITVSKELFVENSVIVLDVSASMQAMEEGSTRFDKAIEVAQDKLGSRNTIILVSNVPQILVENEGENDARQALDLLKPRDTETSLYDAIMAAKDYTQSSNSKVTVISDFIGTETESGYITAKRALESVGVAVELVNVATYKAKNIGIIDIDIKEDRTTVWIKNFNTGVESIEIKVGDLSDSLSLNAGDVEPFSFETPSGVRKIELQLSKGQDDFAPDNIAYLSTPAESAVKVLMFTNAKGRYLPTALSLMKNVNVEVTVPPKVPTNMNYDIFIFENVDKDKLLPRTIDSIKSEVDKGSSFIIMASDSLFSLKFGELLPVIPVRLLPLEEQSVLVKVSDNLFTKDIDFGVTNKYMIAQSAPGSTPFLMANNNATVMAIKKYGAGKVFYYGIFDENSDFKGDLRYPIFWKRMIDFMVENQDINNLNFKTGKILFFGEEQSVKTPLGNRKSSSLILDAAGSYTLNDRIVAASLISEKESRINKEKYLLESEGKEIDAEGFTKTKNKDLGEYAIMLALLLITLEILFLKFRGDI